VRGYDPHQSSTSLIHLRKRTQALRKTSVVAWDQIGQGVMRAALAKKTPDVCTLTSMFIGQQIGAKAIQPLDKYLSKMSSKDRDDLIIHPNAIDAARKIYAVPYDLRVHGYIYRVDLFKKAGIGMPESLEEWPEATKKIQEVAGKDFIGIGIAYGASGSRALFQFVPVLVGMGAKVINEDGTAAFSSPQAEKLLSYLYDLVHKYKVMPLDVALMNAFDLELMAESGRMGFVYEGTHKLDKMRERAPAGVELSYMAPLGFGKGNKSPAMLEAWNLAIPAYAKNPNDAWKFIEHWISPDIQLYQSHTVGCLPVRKSLGDHPSFNTPATAHIKPALKYLLDNPLKLKWPENTDAVNDALRHAIINVLTNKMSSKEALAEAEKNYNRVVKK